MTRATKLCRRCDQQKSLDAFYVRRHNKTDGLSSYCMDCTRRINALRYRRRRAEGHGRARTGHERLITEFVLSYLASHPCADCGETDLVVLTFDHLPEFTKIATISQMSRTSCPTLGDCQCMPLVEQEIAKCEVVCANDHARRSARRGNWQRAVRMAQR